MSDDFDPAKLTDEQLEACADENSKRWSVTYEAKQEARDESNRVGIDAALQALGELPDPETASVREVVLRIARATHAAWKADDTEGCVATAYFLWVNELEPDQAVANCVGAFWYQMFAIAAIAIKGAGDADIDDELHIPLYGSAGATVERAIERSIARDAERAAEKAK